MINFVKLGGLQNKNVKQLPWNCFLEPDIFLLPYVTYNKSGN